MNAQDLQPSPGGIDFSAVHAALQAQVDGQLASGLSCAVLRGRELIDLHCCGFADRESGEALRPDHIFRAASNTKLVTSIAVMQLVESGRLGLDDAIENYIPELGARRVLRPGATSLDDTEPARSAITVRHLLSHSSGLSYGLLDPGTLLFKAYTSRVVLNPATPLSDMMKVLADLPLAFHPGTAWEYSVATDVLGRLVEVVSGERLDAYFQQHIFDPLGMIDTGFVVPDAQQHRLTALYAGADLLNPLTPGLTRVDHWPFPGAFRRSVPRLSGGGGLVTTLPDMLALLRGLLPGGPTVLRADTIAQMMSNQLPDGVTIRFATLGEIRSKAYGLGGAVTIAPSSIDPPDSEGEFQWGGICGTHWWILPKQGLAGLLMTQRQMGFWHPMSFDFKRRVVDAVAAAR